MDAVHKFTQTVAKAYHVKSDIRFEVFIHKVDGLSDETKMETQTDISQRVNDALSEQGLESKAQVSSG